MIRSCTHPARPRFQALAVLLGVASAVGVVAVSLPASATPAAQPPCPADGAGTRTKDIVVTDKRDTFDMTVHPDIESTVELPGSITNIVIPDGVSRRIWYSQSDDGRAFAFIPKHLKKGRITTLTLGSVQPHLSVTALVRVASKAEEVDHSLYRIHLEPPKKACPEKVDAETEKKLEEQRQRDEAAFAETRKQDQEKYEQEARAREKRVRRAERIKVARMVLHRHKSGDERIPFKLIRELSNRDVALRLMEPQFYDGELMVPYELTNRGGSPIESTGIRVMSAGGAQVPVDVKILEDSHSKPLEFPMLIPGGGKVWGVFSVPAQDETSLPQPLTLIFTANQAQSTVAEVTDWHAAVQDSLRREKLRTQTTVSINPIAGVQWLGDGTNQGRLAPTGVGGVAMRVQKGYYWGGALEGTIMGVKTGGVRFEDVSWDGSQGDITRRATLVRALGGFAMRFGDQFVFTGRLGLGFQMAVNDSQFFANGSPADGPNDGLKVQGIWSIGAGLDRRLGEHWRLGMTATFTDAFNNDPSLEGGMQLSYGWN